MSKSGSKALSKSVDASVKSVVKSVESVVTSVVPKNMNMKHVLLAILVGLLLCMLMGNTVEGYKCTPPASPGNGISITGTVAAIGSPGSGAPGPSDTDIQNEAAKYSCTSGTPKVTCNGPNDGEYVVSCSGVVGSTGSGVLCNADPNAGPYRLTQRADESLYCGDYCKDTSAKPPAYTAFTQTTINSDNIPLVISPTAGYCYGSGDKLTNNVCSKINVKGDCDDRVNCSWKDFTTLVDEETDPHFRNLYNKIISGSLIRAGCPSSEEYLPEAAGIKNIIIASQETRPLQLYLSNERDRNGSSVDVPGNVDGEGWAKLKVNAVSGNDIYYDFFRLLLGSKVDDKSQGGNKKPVSELISESIDIPAELKVKLKSLVVPVEENWEKLDPNKALLNLNGGRVIAGYNSTDGLVIRNIPTQPIVLSGSRASFHRGAGCPDTWDSTANRFKNPDHTCALDHDCSVIKNNRKAIVEELPTILGTDIPLMFNETVRTYCSLDSCASGSDPLPECLPNAQLLKFENQISNLASKVSGYFV